MQLVRKAGADEGASEGDGRPALTKASAYSLALFAYAGLALLMLILAGTWLVWFSQYLHHRLVMEDIHAACARLMPDNKERCTDTVIIQRGGVRR